jgi:hypothetical protein
MSEGESGDEADETEKGRDFFHFLLEWGMIDVA